MLREALKNNAILIETFFNVYIYVIFVFVYSMSVIMNSKFTLCAFQKFVLVNSKLFN